jgi:glycosyltransferase involved in cell wall biosynthesis
LLLHYLPTLLQNPEPKTLRELSPREQHALNAADVIVTPSQTLRALVLQLRPGVPCAAIEPGVARAPAPRVAREHTCSMVCNVTENKGVLPFLRALAQCAAPADDFQLRIAGRLDLEPAYAEACRALVAESPWLSAHVAWLSGLAPEAVMDELARAGVFASASRMESYGMALAEARACGTPIVARAGGHVAAHVRAADGGELVADESALAQALLRLMRSPDELARRQQLAAAKPLRRSWAEAARELERFHASWRAAAG